MKKLLLFIILLSGLSGIAHAQALIDTTALDAAIKSVQDAKAVLEADKIQYKTALGKATVDSSALAQARTAQDSAALLVTYKDAEAAVKKAKAKVAEDEETIARYTVLVIKLSNNESCHECKEGNRPGGLGIFMIAIIIVLIIALIVFLANNVPWLREALSENTLDKIVSKNPEYAQLSGLIASLIKNSSSSPAATDTTLAEKNAALTTATNNRIAAEKTFTDAQEVMNAAGKAKEDALNQAVTTATNNRDTAKNAATGINDVTNPLVIAAANAQSDLTAAEAAATPDEVAKAVEAEKAPLRPAFDAAQAELTKMTEAENKAKADAEAAAKVSAAVSLTPAMMVNLGNLFPPTIELSPDATGSKDVFDKDGKKLETAPANQFRPSASRLIAFISGLLIIIVGLSMTCFYIYYYLCTGFAPDLAPLSVVLIALGIGMAPYVVNKVGNAAGAR